MAVGVDRLLPLTVAAAVTLLTGVTRMAADTVPTEAEAAILPMELVAAAAAAVIPEAGQATLAVTVLVLMVAGVTVVVVLMAVDQPVTLAAVAAVAAQAATIDQRPAPTDLVMVAEMQRGFKIRTTRATLHQATVLLLGRAIMVLALREPEEARPIMVALEPRQQGTAAGMAAAPPVRATPPTDSSPIIEYCSPFEPFTSTRYCDNCFVRASDSFGDYYYMLMFFFTIKFYNQMN